MLPSPQEIIGFLEVANTLNITKAAARMGITQPSLSQSLKKLESIVGENLLIRSKSGVEITVAGKEFHKHAKSLLESWEKIKSETKKSQSEVKGNAKLGCHSSVGLYTLDLFLPEVIRSYPEIELSLSHDLSRKITEKVISYEIDLGLVINPIKHPDLMMTKLFEDEVKIWKVKGQTENILLCHPELLQTQHILKKIDKKKKFYNRIITTNSLEIITKLALKGCGYAVLPERVVRIFDRSKTLRPLSDTPVFKDELYLIFRVEYKNIQYIKILKDAIIKSLQVT